MMTDSKKKSVHKYMQNIIERYLKFMVGGIIG